MIENGVDTDGDGILTVVDNCPESVNPDQEDLDSDGRGDDCDIDIDNDGYINELDYAPRDSSIYYFPLDEVEPNDSASSAMVLDSGVPTLVTGAAGYKDDDYFVVGLGSDGRVNLSVLLLDNKAPTQYFKVYDSDGQELVDDWNIGYSPTESSVDVSNKVVVIRLRGNSLFGNEPKQPYELGVITQNSEKVFQVHIASVPGGSFVPPFTNFVVENSQFSVEFVPDYENRLIGIEPVSGAPLCPGELNGNIFTGSNFTENCSIRPIFERKTVPEKPLLTLSEPPGLDNLSLKVSAQDDGGSPIDYYYAQCEVEGVFEDGLSASLSTGLTRLGSLSSSELLRMPLEPERPNRVERLNLRPGDDSVSIRLPGGITKKFEIVSSSPLKQERTVAFVSDKDGYKTPLILDSLGNFFSKFEIDGEIYETRIENGETILYRSKKGEIPIESDAVESPDFNPEEPSFERRQQSNLEPTSQNVMSVGFIVDPDLIESGVDIEGWIDALLVTANFSLRESQISSQLAYVGSITNDLTAYETSVEQLNYQTCGDATGCGSYWGLSRTSPFSDWVNEIGADFVVGLSLGGGNLCGLAWKPFNDPRLLSSDYLKNLTNSRVYYQSEGGICDLDALAHEIGHNLSLTHDRQTLMEEGNEPPFSNAFPDGFGFKLDESRGTIMAYGSSVYLYSNPSLELDGIPLGLDLESDEPSDSARVINLVSYAYETLYANESSLGLPYAPEISEGLSLTTANAILVLIFHERKIGSLGPKSFTTQCGDQTKVTTEPLVVFDNLTPDTQYECFTYASNSLGDSPVSSTVVLKTAIPEVSVDIQVSGSGSVTGPSELNVQIGDDLYLNYQSNESHFLRKVSGCDASIENDRIVVLDIQESCTLEVEFDQGRWELVSSSPILNLTGLNTNDRIVCESFVSNSLGKSPSSNVIRVVMNDEVDRDGDGIGDSNDDLPYDPNESVDTDGDGIGNNEETDDDNDGVEDLLDAFPLDVNESIDTDGDGVGNNEDTDDDGDGVEDSLDVFPLDPDESLDTDGDGIGNNEDTDDDGDSIEDALDAFPLDVNESIDTDGDGIGNNEDTDDDDDGLSDVTEIELGTDPFDPDSDNDGVDDRADAFPLDISESVDTDGDGVGNNEDSDDDGDGISDLEDPYPLYPGNPGTFQLDVDGDGRTKALTDGLLIIRHLFGFSGESLVAGAVPIGSTRDTPELISEYLNENVEKMDIDGDQRTKALTDGLLIIRYLFGFSGESLISGAVDPDGSRSSSTEIQDYFSTILDSDTDGFLDIVDEFPNDSSEWLDTDGDGLGNNSDTDDDGDTVEDGIDAFPLDPDESLDTDGDGVGNNEDVDDDGDGFADAEDVYPLDPERWNFDRWDESIWDQTYWSKEKSEEVGKWDQDIWGTKNWE